MDKDTEQWYEDQFDLFATEGWKAFIAQVKEIREGVDKLSSVLTPEDLYRRKGELKQIDWLLSWQQSVNRAYDSLQTEAE